MWGNVGRCGAGMRSARGEPRSCTQCPPARPPPNPQLSVSSLLGCFIGGGFGPISYTAALTPPHGCSPQCLRCGQRGSDPHSDPHPGLCSAPPSPIPLSATTPNPSVPPPTPPQTFKNPNQTPLFFVLCYLEMFTPSAQRPPPPPQPAVPTDGSAAADGRRLPLGAARCQRVQPGPARGAHTAAGVAIGWCRAFCP